MKIEAQETAVFQTMKVRQIMGAATSGSSKLAKAFGKLASSKKTIKSAPSLSLNKRLLATIKEPYTGENPQDFLTEHFCAPSVEMSINETASSANPPSLPRRQVSMDFPSADETPFTKKIEAPNGEIQSENTSSVLFDRFLDETTPCNKAPPSKPFKRTSMDYGFRDSTASTISAMTIGSSLDGSFVSCDDDIFSLDI